MLEPITTVHFLIYTGCLIASGFHFWTAGKKQGSYDTLTYLEEEGIIEFVDPENEE